MGVMLTMQCLRTVLSLCGGLPVLKVLEVHVVATYCTEVCRILAIKPIIKPSEPVIVQYLPFSQQKHAKLQQLIVINTNNIFRDAEIKSLKGV